MNEPFPTTQPWHPLACLALVTAIGHSLLWLDCWWQQLLALCLIYGWLWWRIRAAIWPHVGFMLISCGLLGLSLGLSSTWSTALQASLRLACLGISGLLLFVLVEPSTLIDSLYQLGLPLNLVRLLEGTLSSLPAMLRIIQQTRASLASRGIRTDRWYLLRNGRWLVLPILAQALQHADDLAEALHTRGLSDQRPTMLQVYLWRWQDCSLLVLSGLSLLIWFY